MSIFFVVHGVISYLFLQEKLRFQAIRHVVTKIDCQPTAENGVVMLVTGQLKVLSVLCGVICISNIHICIFMHKLCSISGAYEKAEG